MDYSHRLLISYCDPITVLNEEHGVSLVQHRETKKIYVKKLLSIYNRAVFEYLYEHPIKGTPAIAAFTEENGVLTVLEEYISGTSLSERIATGPLPEYMAIQIMLELCGILKQLHSCEPPIIHRDIKPSNIIITAYDHIVLLDFNAAKFYSTVSDSDTVLLGTQGYAAPEQYGFGTSTPMTDLYAAGVLLREMIESIPGAVERYRTVIETCTQIDPKNRYQSASDLENAIAAASTAAYSKRVPATKQEKSSEESENKTERTVRRFLPPGFRTGSFWKMLAAILGYGFIFYVGITLEVTDGDGSVGWIIANKVFFILSCLSVVLISCNYQNVQKILPLCRHRNMVVRIISVMVLDVLSVIIIVSVLGVLQRLFFPVAP